MVRPSVGRTLGPSGRAIRRAGRPRWGPTRDGRQTPDPGDAGRGINEARSASRRMKDDGRRAPGLLPSFPSPFILGFLHTINVPKNDRAAAKFPARSPTWTGWSPIVYTPRPTA